MNINTTHPIMAWSPGATELIIFLFIVLLLFGSKKLPGLARSLGQSLTEFKKGKELGTHDQENAPNKYVEKEKNNE